jgi:hypothetical protein
MSVFTVESGIEVSPMGSSLATRRYPWFSMEVGQSFFVPLEEGLDQKEGKSVRASSWPSATVCVSIRKATKDGVDGLRAWLSVKDENGEIFTSS